MDDRRSAPRILIIGGGAGGLELAIRLARATRREERAQVILVDPEASHVWKPRLHEIAVGLKVADDERARYAELAARYGFEFLLGAVDRVDGIAGEASIAATSLPDGTGELLPRRTVAFDSAVLAIGSTVDDFGTPGVLQHCFMLDSAEGAERLHQAFLAKATRIAAGLQQRLRVVVVGAGTTGVELAADLRSATGRMAQYRSLMSPGDVEVTIIEMADRPLPAVATDTSAYARRVLTDSQVEQHYGAKVTRVEAGTVRLADGGVIEGDVLVWASGVRGRSIAVAPAPVMERGGRMRVDATLRLVGEGGQVSNRLYAIGDCAACFEPGHDKPVGATAQAAHQQARLLARSLAGQLRGRAPLPFRFRFRGTLVSLGAGKAVGDVPAAGASFRVAGAGAKLAYNALYQAHLREVFGWSRTLAMSLASVLRGPGTPGVKLHW